MALRARVPCLLLVATLLGGCAGEEASRTARSDRVAESLLGADAPLLRARPGLVAGKYARMAGDLFSFYRGTMPLWLADATSGSTPVAESAYDLRDPMPVCIGDSHPENFGTLRAPDGSLAVEANDFDAADRYPYLWDLRRLTVGLVLAARLSNPDDEKDRKKAAAAAPDIVRAAARAYAETVAELAAGGEPKRLDDPGGDKVLDDLFDAAKEAAEDREELLELTEVIDGVRRLRRGVVADDEPTHALGDLPGFALAALPATLDGWRMTLLEPPPASYLAIKDAARETGTGVASWPRVRALVLVEGPSAANDDDVVLEVKELTESGAAPWLPPGPWVGDPARRVIDTTRSLWARPDADPLWGVGKWLGFIVQVRTEAGCHRNVRVHRLRGDAGKPKELVSLAKHLGGLVGRMHAAPVDGLSVAGDIAAAIGGDVAGFADEQVAVSLELADIVEDDWRRFQAVIEENGPLLGFIPTSADSPSADLRALFTEPPY